MEVIGSPLVQRLEVSHIEVGRYFNEIRRLSSAKGSARFVKAGRESPESLLSFRRCGIKPNQQSRCKSWEDLF